MDIVLINCHLHILAKDLDCLELGMLCRNINAYLATDSHHAEVGMLLLQHINVQLLACPVVL